MDKRSKWPKDQETTETKQPFQQTPHTLRILIQTVLKKIWYWGPLHHWNSQAWVAVTDLHGRISHKQRNPEFNNWVQQIHNLYFLKQIELLPTWKEKNHKSAAQWNNVLDCGDVLGFLAWNSLRSHQRYVHGSNHRGTLGSWPPRPVLFDCHFSVTIAANWGNLPPGSRLISAQRKRIQDLCLSPTCFLPKKLSSNGWNTARLRRFHFTRKTKFALYRLAFRPPFARRMGRAQEAKKLLTRSRIDKKLEN